MTGKHRRNVLAPPATSAGLRPRGPFILGAVRLLLVLLLFVLLLPAQPASAQKARWVLVETAINPDGHGLEFYGGGSTPLYYGEPRYEGKYQIYTVTETSFSLEDRWVDYGEEWYHITLRSSFDAPPAVLVPGETYPLRMDFSHTGSVKKGNPFVAFSYSSPNVAIGSETPLPDNVLRYFPWAEVPSTVSSMTWLLRPPPTSQAGLTLEIYAGWSSPCVVKWVYRSEIGAPEYGVIEIDGVIHLVAPPGGVLRISRADLPEWARDAVATVGDEAVCVGPPATLTEGDPTVLLDGKPVVRAMDGTSHGGIVVSGNSRILVNGVPAATVGDHQVCPMVTGVVPHVGGPILGRPRTPAPRTPTSGQGNAVQPQPRTFTEGEFEKMKTNVAAQATSALGPKIGELMKQGYIGMVIAATGDCALYDYTGERMRDPAGRMIYSETGSYQLVRVGDTLQTGSNGAMRIELFDWDGNPRHRPSVVNMATNTTSVFDWFGQDPSSSTVISLLRGALRTISGVWKDPNLTIKAAVTLCYVKGSDVLISYDPENDVLAPPGQAGPVEYLGAWVLEGHMDVTDSSTDKTESLTDRQMVMAIDGAMNPVGSFSEEQWDEWVKSLGVWDMQPLSTEEWEALVYGGTPTTTPSTSARAEFEEMLADVVAFVESYGLGRGLLYETELLKDGYIGLLESTSGELSVYDHAGQAVDLSVPRIDAEDRGYLLPIRIGDTIRTGDGKGVVYIFTRYRGERVVLEVDPNTEVVFTSAGTGTNEVSATLLEMVRGMVRTRFAATSSSNTFSLEVGATLLRAGQGSDFVISYDPGEGIAELWAIEGNIDVTSSRTDETMFLNNGWGLVVEDGELGAYRPLTDDLWDGITLGSVMDDVKPCKVVAVTRSGRSDGRPLALVEFEASHLSLILAVVIPVVVVVAAGAGIFLFRRRRRRATGGAAPPAGTPAPANGPAPGPGF